MTLASRSLDFQLRESDVLQLLRVEDCLDQIPQPAHKELWGLSYGGRGLQKKPACSRQDMNEALLGLLSLV